MPHQHLSYSGYIVVPPESVAPPKTPNQHCSGTMEALLSDDIARVPSVATIVVLTDRDGETETEPSFAAALHAELRVLSTSLAPG